MVFQRNTNVFESVSLVLINLQPLYWLGNKAQ